MKTKHLFVTLAVSVVVAAPVLAADSLAGPYVGAKLGLGDTSSTIEDTDCWYDCSAYTLRKSSAVGGVQAGWNWVGGSLLSGVSLDYVLAGSGNSLAYGQYYNDSSETYGAMTAATKIKDVVSVRGKLGLVVGDTAVVASGGFASAKIDSTLTYNITANYAQADASRNYSGTVIGVSVDHALGPHLSLSLDLSQYEFNSKQAPFLGSDTNNKYYTTNNYSSVAIAALALNYRF
jgi:hypothetical protein